MRNNLNIHREGRSLDTLVVDKYRIQEASGPLFAERATVDPLVASAIELEDVGNLKMLPVT